MKLQCNSCHKVFLYAKKTTKNKLSDPMPNLALPHVLDIVGTDETHVCPFCGSLELTEFEEPKTGIVSVKSVPLEEVDLLLAEGYIVHELYAKTATMTKMDNSLRTRAEILAAYTKKIDMATVPTAIEDLGYIAALEWVLNEKKKEA